MAADHDEREPITIVLADDHTVLRSGLRMLLDAEPGFAVVGEAGTISHVFEEIRTHRPGVLVLDLNMPGGSSIDAIGRIRLFSPQTAIVVLTMEPDRSFMRAAYDAGARAYVTKDAAATQLVAAIHRAVEGTPGQFG